MRAVIHIGPPKTGTTSIQEGLLPHLGRPFQCKPPWVAALCKHNLVEIPVLEEDVIVSDEALGLFQYAPPGKIARRLGEVFPRGGTIIHVYREPLDLFRSFYRQQIINALIMLKDGRIKPPIDAPITPDAFFDYNLRFYDAHKIGLFAAMNIPLVQEAFSSHFRFVRLAFSQLVSDPDAFTAAFCNACDRAPDANLRMARENVASLNTVEDLLAATAAATAAVGDQVRHLYANIPLSGDRAQFLRGFAS